MTIDTLNPLVPADTVAVAAVPDAIRDIVVALQASFPSLVGAIALADDETLSPTWATISSVTSQIKKSWNGIVRFALSATYSTSITTSPVSVSISTQDMTGYLPAGSTTQPVLPVWGLNGTQWVECGYLLFSASGISFVKYNVAGSFSITEIRVLGCYNVA